MPILIVQPAIPSSASSIRRVFDRSPVGTAAQALVVTVAIAGWL
jgi:hypothetical protein